MSKPFDTHEPRGCLTPWCKADATDGAGDAAISTDLNSSYELQRLVAQLQRQAAVLRGVLSHRDRLEQELSAARLELEHQTSARQQLLDEKAQAEQRLASKGMFLAYLSHEIRTPLTAIIGFSQLLQEPRYSASDRARFVGTIARNSRELAALVDDLLDFSKFEAGRGDVEFLPFAPREVLEQVVASLRPGAEEKGLVLDLSYRGETPETIVSDAVRLKQILTNLVSNAIKFTQRGRVEICMQMVKRGAPGTTWLLKFTVTDTGCGIAAANRGRLFQPYVQADCSINRRFGGSGLGLVISRHLARLLGGDVVLSASQVDGGSTFTATIEAAKSAFGSAGLCFANRQVPPSALRHEAAKPPLPLDGLKVLLVDDVFDNRTMIEQVLKLQGAQVDSAENGEVAVERASTDEYHVVLMDLQMPVLDGYDATSRLRQMGFTKPIIALTAHALKKERTRCIEVGCTGHLVKPIDHRDLIETLTRIVH